MNNEVRIHMEISNHFLEDSILNIMMLRFPILIQDIFEELDDKSIIKMTGDENPSRKDGLTQLHLAAGKGFLKIHQLESIQMWSRFSWKTLKALISVQKTELISPYCATH